MLILCVFESFTGINILTDALQTKVTEKYYDIQSIGKIYNVEDSEQRRLYLRRRMLLYMKDPIEV